MVLAVDSQGRIHGATLGNDVNLLVDESVLNERRQEPLPPLAPSQTPWQELYRQLVGQLSTGGCLEPATLYWRVIPENGPPRHSH